MKTLFLFLLTALFTLTLSAQVFKKDDHVEVDPLFSDSLGTNWKQATVLDYNPVDKKYVVKLMNGSTIYIPSKYPEQWIRPFVNKQVVLKYGPGARIPYDKRNSAMKPLKCNGAEVSVKRNIRSQMAELFKDYSYIYVDFTSFKGQNGYENPEVKGQQIYPYKIEMLVHLKRTLVFAGSEYTEYQTWEYDRVYEYAPGPKRTCKFYALSTADGKLVSKGWY